MQALAAETLYRLARKIRDFRYERQGAVWQSVGRCRSPNQVEPGKTADLRAAVRLEAPAADSGMPALVLPAGWEGR